MKANLREILLVGGVVLIGFGIWFVYPPATPIFVGLVMVYLALFHSRRPA